MKSWILACLCLPLPAQARQQNNPGFVINGTVKTTGPLNHLVYLRYEQNGEQKLDSAAITAGNYHFKGLLNYPVKATLFFAVPDSTANYYKQTHFLKPYEYQFYLDAGNLVITADSTLYEASINGSAAHADQQLLEAQLEPFRQKEDSIYQNEGKAMFKKRDSAGIARYMEKQYRLADEKEAARWDFMRQHASSGIILDLLQECTRSYLDPAKAAPVFHNMTTALQQSPAGKKYALRLEKEILLAPGTIAPDFQLNNTVNHPTRLSDFKGKLVLLEFWGSWCGPCRMSNPHLREMYAAYKSRGFEIVAVSCERGGTLQQQQEKWKKALKEDGMNWVNLLNKDGQHPEDVTSLYDVTAFPTKLLIDRNGTIIRRIVGNTPLKQRELEQLVKDHL